MPQPRRQTSEREGLALDWRQADPEALPCAGGEFDAVLSLVGVMFAFAMDWEYLLLTARRS